MTTDFATSNLSKIKTKFRTRGNVTGNFGVPKSKAGSPLKEIGVTNAEVVKLTTQDKYLERLIEAYHLTKNQKLKKFLYEEIRKIKIQNNSW